ncbi:hypothetical protein CK203_060050 [Vitis vinifera]|uniref:DUF4283 domain-containing protein n=1 Tax=Vitis vinifera TaxID=29760 RepID=A0A438GMR1_VITVI|nr:hypothetical protein CK203_060050 [Vitis vinifera]
MLLSQSGEAIQKSLDGGRKKILVGVALKQSRGVVGGWQLLAGKLRSLGFSLAQRDDELLATPSGGRSLNETSVGKKDLLPKTVISDSSEFRNAVWLETEKEVIDSNKELDVERTSSLGFVRRAFILFEFGDGVEVERVLHLGLWWESAPWISEVQPSWGCRESGSGGKVEGEVESRAFLRVTEVRPGKVVGQVSSFDTLPSAKEKRTLECGAGLLRGMGARLGLELEAPAFEALGSACGQAQGPSQVFALCASCPTAPLHDDPCAPLPRLNDDREALADVALLEEVLKFQKGTLPPSRSFWGEGPYFSSTLSRVPLSSSLGKGRGGPSLCLKIWGDSPEWEAGVPEVRADVIKGPLSMVLQDGSEVVFPKNASLKRRNHPTKNSPISKTSTDIWECRLRGLNDREKRRMINSVVRAQKVDLVCCLETKVSEMSLKLVKSLGTGRFTDWGAVDAGGASGGIVFTGVYGPVILRAKEEFWEELGAIKGLWDEPWVRRFSEVIEELNLKDLPSPSGQFTWFSGLNSQAASRLDRFLINNEWKITSRVSFKVPSPE